MCAHRCIKAWLWEFCLSMVKRNPDISPNYILLFKNVLGSPGLNFIMFYLTWRHQRWIEQRVSLILQTASKQVGFTLKLLRKAYLCYHTIYKNKPSWQLLKGKATAASVIQMCDTKVLIIYNLYYIYCSLFSKLLLKITIIKDEYTQSSRPINKCTLHPYLWK